MNIRHQAEADAMYEDEEPFESDDNEYEPPHGTETATADGGSTHQTTATAITTEQRALLRLLGTLDQVEARIAALNQTTTVNTGGPHQVLPITLEDEGEDDVLIGGYEQWQDINLHMTLDSGCCKHVLPADAVPGYQVIDSPGSVRGVSFTVGNGARVPNEGQVSLNIEAETGSRTELISSVFQVAEINRPLMSVSQICGHGFKCVFEKDHAEVIGQSGETICRFEEDRGLYVANMRLKAPSPFPRPER